jgi:FtsZ-interacting cell division protein ZipA
MPELRIILLVAGLIFIGVLAGIEWWRSRGSRPLAMAGHDAPAETRSTHAPLPEINVVRDSRVAAGEALPVIDLGHLEKTGKSPGSGGGIAISGEVAVDSPQDATSTQSILRAHDEPYIGQDDDVSEVRVRDASEPPPLDVNASPEGPKIKLAWPGESERRIVTLRVLPRVEPRFAGRAVRQAFSSSGFWHGPLDIYHFPDAQGRVILSAAALAPPGTFDPSIMDSQRFSGLNMFAVLPGPLAERECFDELVHAARLLAERLDGRITDQHGDELTPARIARLRQSIESLPPARAAGES